MADRAFADTSGLLALAHRRDQYHARAVVFVRKFLSLGGRLVITPLVLAELQGLLLVRRGAAESRAVTQAILGDPMYECVAVDADILEAAAAGWMEKLADQPLTLCDATSFEVMRRERITRAFSYDRHFQVAGFTLLG